MMSHDPCLREPRSLFATPSADPDGRSLSRAASQSLAERIFALMTGGGTSTVGIESRWRNNVRWARNDIATGGDTEQTTIELTRVIRGASGNASTNATADDALRACVGRAESLLMLGDESPDDYPDPLPTVHPHTEPTLWFGDTAAMRDMTLSAVADASITPAHTVQLWAAGYADAAANSRAVFNTQGLTRYYAYTTAQCSITVRDPHGHGSGWAGVDWNDWSRVQPERLAQIALEKCIRSRNPVAIEPGRYTAILEPQAVCDLVAPLVERALRRGDAESESGPFADPRRGGYSRIGQRVIDPRLTLSADPMDPECGIVPFNVNGEPYQAVKWIDQGVLRELWYDREYGLRQLGKDFALPNSEAFRLSSATRTNTIDEMIANTTRGILVTRFNNVDLLDFNSMLATGNTRDGIWLIEHGKIVKPVKNFRFTESPMFILNNVEMVGAPQRVFRPLAPAVVPALMVRDFSFTGVVDAV